MEYWKIPYGTSKKGQSNNIEQFLDNKVASSSIESMQIKIGQRIPPNTDMFPFESIVFDRDDKNNKTILIHTIRYFIVKRSKDKKGRFINCIVTDDDAIINENEMPRLYPNKNDKQ